MNDNDLKNLSTTEIEEFIEWFKMESNKMSLTIYMLDTILTQYVMKDIDNKYVYLGNEFNKDKIKSLLDVWNNKDNKKDNLLSKSECIKKNINDRREYFNRIKREDRWREIEENRKNQEEIRNIKYKEEKDKLIKENREIEDEIKEIENRFKERNNTNEEFSPNLKNLNEMEYSIDRLKELITKKNNTLTAKQEIFYKKDIEDKTLIHNSDNQNVKNDKNNKNGIENDIENDRENIKVEIRKERETIQQRIEDRLEKKEELDNKITNIEKNIKLKEHEDVLIEEKLTSLENKMTELENLKKLNNDLDANIKKNNILIEELHPKNRDKIYNKELDYKIPPRNPYKMPHRSIPISQRVLPHVSRHLPPHRENKVQSYTEKLLERDRERELDKIKQLEDEKARLTSYKIPDAGLYRDRYLRDEGPLGNDMMMHDIMGGYYPMHPPISPIPPPHLHYMHMMHQGNYNSSLYDYPKKEYDIRDEPKSFADKINNILDKLDARNNLKPEDKSNDKYKDYRSKYNFESIYDKLYNKINDEDKENNRVDNERENNRVDNERENIDDEEKEKEELNKVRKKILRGIFDALKKNKKKSTNPDKENKKIEDSYTTEEFEYFLKLKEDEKEYYLLIESSIKAHNKSDVPVRFKILDKAIDLDNKSTIIKKIDDHNKSKFNFGGETSKFNNWLNGLLKIPFGQFKKLPITKENSKQEICDYLTNAKEILDNAVYGHKTVKNQIIQLITQWITNPESGGNVIGIQGPMGNGKTTLVKEGVSKAVDRPFVFITLGGCSDAAYLEGHNYTYEGSLWGKIVDVLMQAQCMNPIIYFDELDKVSETKKGEEIINMLIHLIDTSQNTEFQDKYYSGLSIDISKAIFIFSYNNEKKINPILFDRLLNIKTKGFEKEDKIEISKNYLIKGVLKQLGMGPEVVEIKDEVLDYLIENYTNGEEGVRSLKKCLELIFSKLNVLILTEGTNIFSYDINVNTSPIVLDNKMIDILLKEFKGKSDDDDYLRNTMYM
tara:strand:- start:425 stop:3451 length:3027 start_codon:yes stop_codon:yes gene_type:complete